MLAVSYNETLSNGHEIKAGIKLKRVAYYFHRQHPAEFAFDSTMLVRVIEENVLHVFEALRLHKASVHISIEGLAASIASVIAMAGNTITIAENAMMMIHNPHGWATGDAEAMRKTADVMDKIADSIAMSYTARTGMTIEEMKALNGDRDVVYRSRGAGYGLGGSD